MARGEARDEEREEEVQEGRVAWSEVGRERGEWGRRARATDQPHLLLQNQEGLYRCCQLPRLQTTGTASITVTVTVTVTVTIAVRFQIPGFKDPRSLMGAKQGRAPALNPFGVHWPAWGSSRLRSQNFQTPL